MWYEHILQDRSAQSRLADALLFDATCLTHIARYVLGLPEKISTLENRRESIRCHFGLTTLSCEIS